MNDILKEGLLEFDKYLVDQFNNALFESMERLRWYPITDDPGIIGLNVIKFTNQPIDYQI